MFKNAKIEEQLLLDSDLPNANSLIIPETSSLVNMLVTSDKNNEHLIHEEEAQCKTSCFRLFGNSEENSWKKMLAEFCKIAACGAGSMAIVGCVILALVLIEKLLGGSLDVGNTSHAHHHGGVKLGTP